MNFVSCSISVEEPYQIYGLTNDGTLCVYDSSTITTKLRRIPIVTTPMSLDCGEATSIIMDKKIILCGTKSGSILAIKKDAQGKHKIFGQFSSDGNGVIAIGISERLTAAAYEDGNLMFWQRRINSQPLLIFPSHRGPVCGLSIHDNYIISCGSDSTIRLWKLQRNRELIEKSSQEMICMKTITKKNSNFLDNLTGVRCVSIRNELIFAGDINGNLHILNFNDLSEVKKIIENFTGVLCICAHPIEPYIATGGGDGYVRIYKINEENNNLSLYNSKQYFNSPITSIVFTNLGFAISSTNGIKFCTLNDDETFFSYETNEPILALATIPNGKMVFSCGCDNYLTMFKSSDGSIFRRYKLSQFSYPMCIDIDKSGLFIAIAMSDSSIKILDLFSGSILFSFLSLAGIITSIHFHEGDLLLSSASGCIFRWETPSIIHKIIYEHENENQPILDIILNANEKTNNNNINLKRSYGTLMKGNIPNKDWIFKELNNDQLKQQNPLSQYDNIEEEEEIEQTDFDAPRPNLDGEYETKVDDLVRKSFVRRNNEEQINDNENKNEIEIVENNENEIVVETKTTAEQIREAAKRLQDAFVKAKKLLDVKPSCPEEIAAKALLNTTLEAIRKELSPQETPIKIMEYAKEIMELASKL
ncbi:mitogen-activated protein kinase-binding protein 1 isoform X1 [Histomonas meleagridis]|uniref:mitogen-activated protein kinase-binding protein 1 isoform X1 n=1 Tax=Histomonas meleagridis TaxID=135588 RepID=UPI003559D72D|nr:mitogen-activated protein kinase-binding protein 1 isoform X1 [Histomonas meleagridis]KAH0805775.1 mitogen-activated protein kinase-binding protein 1 isoform X1 [Histomonas meleagridis]